jgi:hypothetical protein
MYSKVAIFLNGEPLEGGRYGAHYEDRWGKNLETNDIHAFVRGQNQGRRDYIIINASINDTPVHFYTRKNNKSPIIFRGIGKVSLERERVSPIGVNADSINEMALFYLKIDSSSVRNETIIGKKREALNHFGTGPNENIQNCFYKLD